MRSIVVASLLFLASSWSAFGKAYFWQLSLRPIRDGEVEWYVSNEQRFPMAFQKLDKVVAEIEAVLKKAPSDQAVLPDGSAQPSEKATRPVNGSGE